MAAVWREVRASGMDTYPRPPSGLPGRKVGPALPGELCRVFPTEIHAWRWNDRGMELSVLVVDDDPSFRELAGRLLADAGSVAAQAETADEAIRAAEQTRPDAALVDVDLPGRDGITLAGQLTALPWRPRVVLTSVDPEAIGPDDVRSSGALAFLAKDQLANGTLVELLGFE